MKEIKPLTSLRGIFALWVLGYHLHALRVVPMTDLYGLLDRGYLGVDFFFLLSGFILARRYGNEFKGVPLLKNYIFFIIHRAFRMFPLNIFVTLICAFSAPYFGIIFSNDQIIQETILIHRWPGVMAATRAINGPAWSISTEWLVNLCFPIFSILTLGFNRFIALSILIIVSGICLWLTISNDWSLDIARSNSNGPFIRCAAEFTIGILIFRWHKTDIGPPRILLPLLAIGVLILLHFKLIDIGIVALMSVAIPLLSQDNSIIARILSVSPLIWLGNLSFSIYLTQEPILRVVRHVVLLKIKEPNAGVIIFVISTVSITILVSFITNRLIEVPFQIGIIPLTHVVSSRRIGRSTTTSQADAPSFALSIV